MYACIHNTVGVTFTAKTVLDVSIYPESSPLPLSMQSPSLFETQASGLLDDYRNIPLKRGVFPRPYADTNLPHRFVMMMMMTMDMDMVVMMMIMMMTMAMVVVMMMMMMMMMMIGI
jgi:hypothetical protein